MARRPSQVDLEVFEQQAEICKAFASPLRLRLLDLLESGERPCSELQASLGITKTNLSQHLSVLRDAGLVRARKNGREILCSITLPEVTTVCSCMHEVLRHRIEVAKRLGARLTKKSV